MDINLKRQLFVLSGTMLSTMCIGLTLGMSRLISIAAVVSRLDIEDYNYWTLATDVVAGILGGVMLYFIVKKCGRKLGHFAICLSLLMGWTIYLFAKSIPALFAARLFHDLTTASIFFFTTILDEYIPPNRSGYFVFAQRASCIVGLFVAQLILAHTTWKMLSILGMVTSFLATILTCFWSDSPIHLAQTGNYEECEKTFKLLDDDSLENQERLKSLVKSQETKEEPNENKNTNTPLDFLNKCFSDMRFLRLFWFAVAWIAMEFIPKSFNLAAVFNPTSVVYFSVGVGVLIVLIATGLIMVRFNSRFLMTLLGLFFGVVMFCFVPNFVPTMWVQNFGWSV